MSAPKLTKLEKDKERLISICREYGIRLEIATIIANSFLKKPKRADEEQLLFNFGDDLDSN